MYHHTKNEVSRSTGAKVIARTDRHTERYDENITSTAYAGGKYWIPIKLKLFQHDITKVMNVKLHNFRTTLQCFGVLYLLLSVVKKFYDQQPTNGAGSGSGASGQTYGTG